MSNPTITNCDLGVVTTGDYETQDETLSFAAADTFVAGTVLARRAVVTAITPSAITGTGNGTCTAAAVTGSTQVPKAGNWILRNILVVTHGGVWQVEDPDGRIVAAGLRMTPGAGVATTFEVGGLTFTLTDGSTDFALNDTFTLPVVADGKLVPFDPSGVGGAQNPMAVLPYEVTKAASGDLRISALVRGRVNATRLVIDAGGSLTSAHLDALRAAGIVALPVQQLSTLDNQ